MGTLYFFERGVRDRRDLAISYSDVSNRVEFGFGIDDPAVRYDNVITGCRGSVCLGPCYEEKAENDRTRRKDSSGLHNWNLSPLAE